MSIGKRLKEARIRKEITQEELAKAVGVTKGAIGNYESEVSSPKETILIKLMDVLGVDANFLYQDYINLPKLSHDEISLLDAYRAADDHAREDAFLLLRSHPRKKISTESSAG